MPDHVGSFHRTKNSAAFFYPLMMIASVWLFIRLHLA